MEHARWLVVLGILSLCQACNLSDHQVVQSHLGKPSSMAEMDKLLDVPGPIEVETVNSADWTVPLAGLLNLKSAAAQAAHLTDHPEPIHIFAHIVRHPKFGTYLVDTGVSQRLIDDPGDLGVSWLVRKVMPLGDIHVRKSTAQILAVIPGGIHHSSAYRPYIRDAGHSLQCPAVRGPRRIDPDLVPEHVRSRHDDKVT
jgi:N-acyl homoserine lactone hydrolase